MKIATVVGARPQFIKAAAGSRQLRKNHKEVLIHTGQHYDREMSEIFFRELGIPNPDYNLGISGGTHSQMTAKMLPALEEVFNMVKPDMVLVYGDTNSTLAAALTAVKMHIPVAHVEAGNRLGDLNNPEDVNRILTDHCSTQLFCASQNAMDNLENENLVSRAVLVGNIMYDVFLYYAEKPWTKKEIFDLEGHIVSIPECYYYMTCHREENTGSDEPLTQILRAMNSLDAQTIYPVHPRNRKRAIQLKNKFHFSNVIMTKPVKYTDSIQLVRHAKKVVTDSGGLQCEAFFAGVQCVTIFKRKVWPETMTGCRNQLADANTNNILHKLSAKQVIDPRYQPFGDGHASEKIANHIGKN